ncbi:MAG: Crp/Fnr family transcriptional regulator, partial [Halobacteriaceae archaeon]
VLGSVNEDTAIATAEIKEGEEVTLQMKEGLLHASPGSQGPATGVATTSASEGEDVGVTSFEGIIDLAPGKVTVYQVPRIRAGGSRAIDKDELKTACSDHDLILATGIEAIVALAKINITPDCIFAVGEIAADAAHRGLDSIVVTATDQVGGVTAPLRSQGTSYEVSQLN